MAAANTAAAGVATPAPAPAAPATPVQVPRGQVDLADFIDWTGVECLNQDSSHSITNALKQVARSSPRRTLARLDHPSRRFQKDFRFWCSSSDSGGVVGCPPPRLFGGALPRVSFRWWRTVGAVPDRLWLARV
jgi:hypothetical protein